MKNKGMKITIVALAVLLIVSIFGNFGDNNEGTGNAAANTQQKTTQLSQVSGTSFSVNEDKEICTEDGKPIIYLFSTTWCPHCQWIGETFREFANKAESEGKAKVYQWEIDINDDALTTEVETEVPAEALAIYKEVNPRGSIPTFVFGCKYSRIGNGYEREDDLAAEMADFEKMLELIS